MFISDPDTNLMLTQISMSTFVVGLMEWMKKTHHFAWITAQSTKVNRLVAFLLSVGVAAGIHLTWSHGSAPGDYTLGIIGATPLALMHAGWEIFKSFMTQQWIFRTAVKPVALAGQVTVPTKGMVAIVEEPPKGA
jgi:hypothetical protein